MKKAVVTGAGSGLGMMIAQGLRDTGWAVNGIDRLWGEDVRCPPSLHQDIDVLVNCAGVNKIGWLEEFSEEDWDEVMDTNVKGIFKMTQAALPALRRSGGTVVNIVSNASHVPMRCSAAYNASKGAASILTKQMARELSPDITVFAVSPNKLAGTPMSQDIDRQVQLTRGWTAAQATAYQKAGLLTGEETDPQECAEFIVYLLQYKDRHKHLTGVDIPYGA